MSHQNNLFENQDSKTRNQELITCAKARWYVPGPTRPATWRSSVSGPCYASSRSTASPSRDRGAAPLDNKIGMEAV